ncbi:5-formyltetrahydrofolate cyclo-ligase [Insulibacter thermoxylanivorax]|uniref:5-formyltetrahydrofolate cyclo-ligase n=1 Tax=Insulibacter thermoxylanivorax TaxID=2749268 RepID=A0A916VES2_9BACL|nr:5-formyltetrahydrofolate cyclo-ligase [Insulibacter thermoxylanivorax]GFR37073.1 5-formyltetrahydrofolate cyclo-ligase [Insulibacter thermoxylanivorax]
MHLDEVRRRKSELRNKIIQTRDELPPEERSSKSEAICERLIQHLKQELKLGRMDGRSVHNRSEAPCTILTYLSFGSEVDLYPFISWCWQQGGRIAAPRTIPAERALVFHYIEGLADTEPVPPYGIREPLASLPAVIDPAVIDMIIMPGTAFDEHGHRLGYGAGYYDRYLAQIAARLGKLPPLVAVCYELQIVEQIPAEEHDVKMQVIITESRKIYT